MIITKVDQRLIIKSKAAETISHGKALKAEQKQSYKSTTFPGKLHSGCGADSQQLMVLVSKQSEHLTLKLILEAPAATRRLRVGAYTPP